MNRKLELIQTNLNFVQHLLGVVIGETETVKAAPPVGSHMIYSWTDSNEHYRIANDASWCTCKGFTYRQYCKHTRSPGDNLHYGD